MKSRRAAAAGDVKRDRNVEIRRKHKGDSKSFGEMSQKETKRDAH